MFREKLIPGSSERGYLYIRDSVYIRDRRTLKKIPKKFGCGKATKERGKYSKKKDIYCGRIIEIKPKNLISFKEYLEKENIDSTLFKISFGFKEILERFVEYILYVYDLKSIDFYSKRKKVYTVGEGYMSPIILNWFTKFEIKGNFHSSKEFKRFYNRAQDCGIFDEEIIQILYLKLIPEVEKEDLLKEIQNLKEINLEEVSSSFKNFIKGKI